jgi:hypothetical protein
VKEMPPPAKTPMEDVTYLWAYKSAVNVRATASASSVIIGQLADGDSVVVLKNEKGWYQITVSSGKTGYIRSDLLSPKGHSIFPRAVHFIDSLKAKHAIEVFFDKQQQHKQIYISYPKEFYKSETAIARATRHLVNGYQKSVYAGSITALVLKPDSEEIYQKYEIIGLINADLLLPVLPFGLLDSVTIELPDKIILVMKIPDGIEDREFIPVSRKMSAGYPPTYTHVEFRFLAGNGSCRFWFLEDGSGEQYCYNRCP